MSKKKTGKPQFGSLPPLYRFILNPNKDVRFSTCPNCSGKTLIRKVLLFIQVKPVHPTAINLYCRYCPKGDILVTHAANMDPLQVSMY